MAVRTSLRLSTVEARQRHDSEERVRRKAAAKGQA
jgi:hypothetical protein